MSQRWVFCRLRQLADRAEVQMAYAMGVARPLSRVTPQALCDQRARPAGPA